MPKNNSRPKKKKAKPGKELLQGKNVRHEKFLNSDNQLLSWRIGLIDVSGPWGWTDIEKDKWLSDVLPKAQNFETMTWSEINNNSRGHLVKTDSLITQAQQRLVEIQQDDIEALFCLRIDSRCRLWGIREGHTLKLLWYDPKHEVCPSKMKHT